MKKKIIITATLFQPIDIFLGKLINKLSENNQIIIITNNIYHETRNINLNNDISLVEFGFVRKPNLISDLFILLRLIFYFKKLDNFIVLTITPKASFLTALSNFILFKKFKIFSYVTGQVWVTKKNPYKFLLKLIDLFIFKNTSILFVDSEAQLNFLKDNGFNSTSLKLINNGSICGVNPNIFKKNNSQTDQFLKDFSLEKNTIKIIYIGRINIDKGINLLIDTFIELNTKYKNLCLFLVSSIIEDNQINLNKHPNIRLVQKRINNPEFFLSNSDIFCLPSFREGFGVSVIEASSCELPVVTSNIYGLKDCMIDGYTGLKFDLSIKNDLYNKLEILIQNQSLREVLGKNGRSFVIKKFNENEVIEFQFNEIKKYI